MIKLTIAQEAAARKLADYGGTAQRYTGRKGQTCWTADFKLGGSMSSLYGTMVMNCLHKKGLLVEDGDPSPDGTQKFKLKPELVSLYSSEAD